MLVDLSAAHAYQQDNPQDSISPPPASRSQSELKAKVARALCFMAGQLPRLSAGYWETTRIRASALCLSP